MISISQVFHCGVVAYYIVVSTWIKENMIKHKDIVVDDPLIKDMKLYSLRYLTNWTFTLQTIYFFIVLIEDVINLFKGLERIKERINKFRNYLFTVLVLPMALLVTIIFWSFWFVDRELIFPAKMDLVLPLWMNHALHTTTSVLALIEMYMNFHKYPKFLNALMGITMYLLVYSLCLVGTYYNNGVWLYPIFKILNWTERIVMCLVVYAFAIAIYGALYFLNKVIWGDKVSAKKIPKKKHKKH